MDTTCTDSIIASSEHTVNMPEHTVPVCYWCGKVLKRKPGRGMTGATAMLCRACYSRMMANFGTNARDKED